MVDSHAYLKVRHLCYKNFIKLYLLISYMKNEDVLYIYGYGYENAGSWLLCLLAIIIAKDIKINPRNIIIFSLQAWI